MTTLSPRAGARRIAFLAVCGGVVALAVAVRLAQIQIRDRKELREKAMAQYLDRIELPMDRGKIYDRNGELLAVSLDCVSVVANPSEIADPGAVAERLAPLLEESPRELKSRLSTGSHFERLRRKVRPQVGREVDRRQKELPGIYTIPDKERIHPAGKSLAAIVGVTDVDERGLEGIELACETVLAGKPGWRILQRVNKQLSIPTMLWSGQSPEAGQSVVLSIDTGIQEMVELELERAVASCRARRGVAVVLDPDNGDVLAMAAAVGPSGGAAVRPTMNLITSMQLEPGSTFKLVAYAAALEKKLYGRHDLIDAGSGVVDLGPLVLRDAHARGLLTFQEAFERSSNICTAKVSLRVGEEPYYRMARRFGFGTRTGIDLPGEIPGILRKPRGWSARSLPTMAIGHEVTVTPLQLACAYAAIANGGILYEPRMVLRIVDRHGRAIRENPARPVRRVVSEETARTLQEFMQGVVVEGTAKRAYLDRWGIAGKTGTAYKPAGSRGYDRTKVMASFAGFVPAWDPRLVAVVVIDEPAGALEGGAVAAPAFRAMVERLVSTSTVPLHSNDAPIVGPSPAREDFVNWEGFLASHPPRMKRDSGDEGTERVDARTLPNARSAERDEERDDEQSQGVDVAGGAETAADSAGAGARVPDLFGSSLRLAVRTLIDAGFEPIVAGTGIVVEQDPPAGARALPGSPVALRANAGEEILLASKVDEADEAAHEPGGSSSESRRATDRRSK